MSFYDDAAPTAGGFEEGVRTALQAMLASPYFVFRFETAPANVAAGQDYRSATSISRRGCRSSSGAASRTTQLLTLAQQHKLSEPKTLEREVKRMLADPRSEALSTRFAAQWLRLQDLEKVHPDAFLLPGLRPAARRRHARARRSCSSTTSCRNDHSVLDLFTADYTFVNERLARHYGIPNVSGHEFRA